jgi:hypothetical protein
MDGRVVNELLKKKNITAKKMDVKIERTQTSAKYNGGTYILNLQRTRLGNYQYVDFAKVKRELDTVKGD